MSRPRPQFEQLEGRRLFAAYYVSPFGSDANAGSAEAPWASTSRVNALNLEPGDHVLFQAGATFAGGLVFTAEDAGTPAQPVVVGSYGGGRATVSAGAGDGLSATNVTGFVVQDLAVVGAGPSGNGGSGVRFDNNLPGNVKLPHLRVDRVDVSGFGRYGITVGGSNGKSGFRDVRITYCDAHANGLGGIESHGVYSTSVAAGYAHEDLYVGHCRAYDNPGVPGYSSHSGNGIVLSDCDRGLIERSEAFNNGALNTHVGGPVGIWVWDVNGFVIQHNESHHNRTNSTADGGGFDLDGGVTNSVIQYNYSHDNDGAGYGIFQFKDARPFHHNTVRYNISQNDGRRNHYAGIQIWNGGSGIRDTDVYNNTVYVAPAAGATPGGLYVQTGTTNVTLRNNIFQVAPGLRVAEVLAKQTNLLMQGNSYYAGGSSLNLKFFAKTYSTLADFRNRTGQERLNGVNTGSDANPQLVNPGGGGTAGNADLLEQSLGAYQLRPTSPLVNRGLNLWSQFGIDPGRRDLFGTPLPSNSTGASSYLYDVGAGEGAASA